MLLHYVIFVYLQRLSFFYYRIGTVEQLIKPKRRVIRKVDPIALNVPDLPDDDQKKPGRPSTGGRAETQRRKRAKYPERTKRINNAQKLRRSVKILCDGAGNDLDTIAKTAATTIRSEFIRRKEDFKRYSVRIDFQQFVSLLTAATQKKLDRMDDDNFLGIDEIFFERPQHRELLKGVFPDFFVDGKFVPARGCSDTSRHGFFRWVEDHNKKAYTGMPYIAALLTSLNPLIPKTK
jgi:hypothetical protein